MTIMMIESHNKSLMNTNYVSPTNGSPTIESCSIQSRNWSVLFRVNWFLLNFSHKSPTLSRIYCSLIQKYRYYFIYFLHFHENCSFVSIIYLTNDVEWTINRCKNEYILMSKWLQPGIHTPLGSRTGRCELVRYISVLLVLAGCGFSEILLFWCDCWNIMWCW